MKVTNIQAKRSETQVTYSAEFTFSNPIGGRKRRAKFLLQTVLRAILHPIDALKSGFSSTHTVWYIVPNEFAIPENVHDAFFILALPLAIATNEDLEFVGDISKELKAKIEEMQSYYHEVAQRKIAVHLGLSTEKTVLINKTGQFFTLGVDSFHTLCCHTESGDLGKRHLFYIDGYDIPWKEKQFFHTIHKNIEAVAEETNTRAVFLQTNIREISDLILGWGFFHFTALSAVCTLIGFKKMYISGESFNTEHWGLRFGAETLYSMNGRHIVLVGHNVSRLEKTRRVVHSEHAKTFLKYVRVCWENVRNKHLVYNCSVCQKCLKTKLGLQALGVTDTPTFQPIDIQAVKKLHLVSHVYQDWVEVYEILKNQEMTDSQLLSAIDVVLKKPMRT